MPGKKLRFRVHLEPEIKALSDVNAKGGEADKEPSDGHITVSKALQYSLTELPVLAEQLGIFPQAPVGYRRGSMWTSPSASTVTG